MTNSKINIIQMGEGWSSSPFQSQRAEEIVQTHDVMDVVSVLRQTEQKTQEGYYAIGFLSYEAADAFDLPVKRDLNGGIPLAWFAIIHPDEIKQSQSTSTDKFDFSTSVHIHQNKNSFQKTLHSLKEQIQAGNTYQVNFTVRASVDHIHWTQNHFFSLFQSQPVPYAAYIETSDWTVLSFSPECFLKREGKSILSVPMKGTHKRGRFINEDQSYQSTLANSEKDKAENIMITDMVRHDLGKICEYGSVRVVDPFNIEPYQTVLQMTSTVEAVLKPATTLHDILEAAFPAASITGAPKHRTMQIIRDHESSPRGIYCGTIGFIKPNGDFTFNVAIRTIVNQYNKSKLGVGSGIVWDSNTESEYEEIRTKTRFLTQTYKPFQLIETILLQEDKTLLYLEEHLDRLQSSANYFSYPFERNTIQEELDSFINQLISPCAVRLLLHSDGHIALSTRESITIPDHPQIIISSKRIDSSDPFYFHKTTNRDLYTSEREKAVEQGFFEAIFMNENDHITEGCITNIFINKNKEWITSPVTDGLLAGVWRDQFIKNNDVSEQHITKNEIKHAEKIVVGNSVFGDVEVTIANN